MRVFLDANVIFSASNVGSNLARLIDFVLADHTLVTSDFALEEARRNVELKRPAWSEGLVSLVPRIEVPSSVIFELPVELDEKDRPILCTAIRAHCDLLVTGDRKHFGHLVNAVVAGDKIVTPLGLAEWLLDEPP